MELGISTGIFYHDDVIAHLPAIARAGFRHVELCTGGRKDGKVLHFDWRAAAYTARLATALRTNGLTVSSLHAPYAPDIDPSHPDAAKRQATLDEFTGVARALKLVGGRTMVLHVAVNEFDLKDAAERRRRLDNIRAVLGPLQEATRALNVRLALENLLPHLLGGDVATLKDLFEPFPADRVGVCFDTSHAHLWTAPSVYELMEQSLPRLMALHLSDNRGRFDDHFSLGDGTIDWTRVAGLLRAARYQGEVILEVFKDVKGSAPEAVLADAHARAKALLNL